MMIAFSSSNVLGAGGGCADGRHEPGGTDYILSIKYGKGYCVSKIFVTSIGAPRQLTVIMVLDAQADIVAVPELYSSVYVPWHSAGQARAGETALAFLKAGLSQPAACCVAIAIDIIYNVIDRDYVDYCGEARDCIFTSSGLMELGDECRERIFSEEHVLTDFPFEQGGETPF